MRLFRVVWLLLFMGFQVGAAQAQQITVQQPQVQVFSVDTTVSVPDQGAILLGGVNRAAEGRQMFGPIPWGTSLGRSVGSATMTAHVWIHDLEAMDRAILAIAARERAGSERPGATRRGVTSGLSASVLGNTALHATAGLSSSAPHRPQKLSSREAAIQNSADRARQQLLSRSPRR